MKNFLGGLIVVLGIFVTTGFVQAEEITNFDARIEVKASGMVDVHEAIDYDFGSLDKHGIFRILKTNHPQQSTVWYKNRSIGITIESVTMDGHDVPFTTTNNAADVTVKVGDGGQTITGKHHYLIFYTLDGALSYGSVGAELYYNVTGNDWPVAINHAHVTVADTTGTLLNDTSACYRGEIWSTDRCTVDASSTQAVSFVSAALSSGEGMTIAQSLHADKVATRIHEDIGWVFVGYVAAAAWLLGLSIWAWRFHTQFKVDMPVIAQYEPYPGITPMYMGVLYDNKLDPHDITAGIVYLAEQGFMKIKRMEEKVMWLFSSADYEFTLTRPTTEVEDSGLSTVLSLFFTTGAAVGTVRCLSDMKGNQSLNAQICSGINARLLEKLKDDGFTIEATSKVAIGVVLVSLIVTVVSVSSSSLVGSVVGIISLIISVFSLNNRRTKLGYEAINYLDGFKLFLSVTDEERFKFFNAPEKNPETFMKYLPYAIALGVETEWAEVFKDITIPNPGWYDGGSIGTFSALSFTSDLGSFSSTFSASSGTQGSSGGGFSGGGGGGGGGGSW